MFLSADSFVLVTQGPRVPTFWLWPPSCPRQWEKGSVEALQVVLQARPKGESENLSPLATEFGLLTPAHCVGDWGKWRGSQNKGLQRCHIPVPEPLFYGRCQTGLGRCD